MTTAWIPLDRFVAELPFDALGLEGVPGLLEQLDLEHLEDLAASQIGVADIRCAWTDDRVIYRGRVRLFAEIGTLSLPLGNGASLDLLGGADGLDFTLEVHRRHDSSATGPSVNRSDLLSDTWRLIVDAPMLAIRLPDSVKPGRLQQTDGGEIAVVDPTGPKPTVFLPRLRLALDSADGISILPPDPASSLGLGLALDDGDFDEGIYEVRMSPPLVVFSEDLGLRVERMVLDLSEKRSIAPVIEAGFSDAWRGFYLEEARLYFTVQPSPLPLKASIGLSDLIWGFDDEGPTGTLSLELYTYGKEQPEALKIKPRLYLSDRIARGHHPYAPVEVLPQAGVYEVAALEALQLVVEVEGGKPPYAFVYHIPDAVHFQPALVNDDSIASHSNRSPRFLFTSSTTQTTAKILVMDSRGGPDDPDDNQVNTVELQLQVSEAPGALATELGSLVIRVDGLSPDDAHRQTGNDRQALANASAGLIAHATGVAPFVARISAMPLGTARYHRFNSELLEASWSVQGPTSLPATDALSFVHTFETPGTYMLEATVEGPGEPAVSGTMTIVVHEAGPVLRLERSSEYFELTNLVPVASSPGSHYTKAPAWTPQWEYSPRKRLAMRIQAEMFSSVSLAEILAVVEQSSFPSALVAQLEPIIGSIDDVESKQLHAMWADELAAYEPELDQPFTVYPNIRAFLKWFKANPPPGVELDGKPVELFFKEFGAEVVGFNLLGSNLPDRVLWRVYRKSLPDATLGTFVPPSGPPDPDEWTLAYEHSGRDRVQIPFVALWSVSRVIASWDSGGQTQTREMYIFQGDELGLAIGGVVDTPKLPAMPFHWFKRAKLQISLYRGELTQFLVSVKLNLRALLEMGKNEDDPEDGIVDVAFTLGRDPFTKRWQWQVSVLSDPKDDDGLFALSGIKAKIAGPLLLLPPILASTKGDGEAALATTAVVAAALAQLGDSPPITFEKVVFQGFRLAGEGDTEIRQLSLGVDYRIDIGLDLALAGLGALQTKDHPIGLGFAGVGLGWNFDKDEPWFGWGEHSGFSLDLRDEGILKFDGWLSDLVSVGRLTMGIGSPMWLKADLNGAIPGGIFRFEKFGFSLSFDPSTPEDPFEVSLSTPPAVTANIPGVLEGRGTFSMDDQEDGFELVVGLQAKIIPLKVSLAGGLRLTQRPEAMGLFLGLMAGFEPGIELFGSGVALKGLAALVAMHYRRTEAPGGDDDPRAPYRWFVEMDPKANATDVGKWKRFAPDHWAFGGGVVLGTSFDSGFSLNVFGMLIVEVPGPVIILAQKVNLFKPANTEAEGEGAQEGALTAVLILDLERNTFYIGIEAKYEIENILEVSIPAEVFFDLENIRNFYIHIGQDDPRKRVRVKVLGLIEAWAYFMLRGQGFEGLAGREVVIPGPGVAFGAGIDWNFGSKSANLYLHLWAELHLAIGADPWTLFGVFSAGGELALLIITIGISATFDALATEEELYLKGKVCGRVRLLFWEIKACFEIDIGHALPLPPPSPALLGLGFAPRVHAPDPEGVAALPDATSDGPGPEIPVDAVPRLLLRWPVDIDSLDSAFVVSAAPPLGDDEPARRTVQVAEGANWRFRLTTLILERKTGPDSWIPEPLPTAWRSPTALALGTWSLLEDALGGDASAAAEARIEQTLTKLCDPVAAPEKTHYTADGLAPGAVGEPSRLHATSSGPTPGQASLMASQASSLPPTAGATVGPVEVVDYVAASFEELAANGACVRFATDTREDRYTLRVELTPHREVTLAIAHPRSIPSTASVRQPRIRLRRTRPAIVRHPRIRPIRRSPAQIKFYSEGRVVETRNLADGEQLTATAFHDEVYTITRCAATPKRTIDAIEVELPRDLNYVDIGVFLLEVTGVPVAIVDSSSELSTDRQRTIDWVSAWTSANHLDPQRLQPDAEYRLRATTRGNWDQPGHALADDLVHDLLVHFRTTAAPLLEPRALEPYVTTSFPEHEARGHYREAPIAVAFRNPTIQAWYADAGHSLLMRVKGDDGHEPLAELLTDLLATEPASAQDELLAALLESITCLGELSLPPSTSQMSAKVPLRSGVRYAVDLVALPTAQLPDEPDALPALLRPLPSLYRFEFRASRHRTLQAHLAAHHGWLHLPADGPGQRLPSPVSDADVLAVAEAVVPATLGPELPAELDDPRALDAFLTDTLGLPASAPPSQPMCMRLWAQQGSAWKIMGWLFDSPDPLIVAGATLRVSGVTPSHARTPQGLRTLVWFAHDPAEVPILQLVVPTSAGLDPLVATLELPAPARPFAEED